MLNLRPVALAAFVLATALGLGATPSPAQQKITIGVSLAQDDNPFYIAMLHGIRDRAQELGWDVATVSANEDKVKQINGVQDLIARGVKGILISPIDAVGVNAAYDALTHGLNIALVASALLMLASAAVAYTTGTAEKLEMVELDDVMVIAAAT